MKKPILFLFLLLVTASAFAQAGKITPADMRVLRQKEDSLKNLVKNVFMDSLTAGRMRSDSLFIRTLVRTLQVKNSFHYAFDSVKGISKVYAPDSTFKIFTWQIDFDGFYIRQRGAIQYNTPDGSLKLVPLRDYSEFADNPIDSVRDKDTWIGAVYYNIIATSHNGKKYYTLFGYDGNNPRSNRKWIEVMSFDNRNLPVFGGPFFSFEKDSIKKPTQHRYHIEYKKEASTMVNYEPELGLILVDHLVSETDEPENAWTLVPDGDYEGFKWQNGKWVHVNKVFTESIDMKGADPYLGRPPMGNPLFDKPPAEETPGAKKPAPKKKGKG